jgi:hypothetical protein
MQGGYLYVAVHQESSNCDFYRCDISTPWDNDNTDGRFNHVPIASFQLIDRIPDYLLVYPPETPLLRPVGLTSVHVMAHDDAREEIPATTYILFHPDIYTAFHPSDTVRLLLPHEPRRHNPHEFSTLSGNYLLYCISAASQDDPMVGKNPQITLIQFVRGPLASIRVRQLPIPHVIWSELEADEINSIAFDDHLGVLYLTNEKGYIFAVPFA